MIVTNIKNDDEKLSKINSITNLPPISSYSCDLSHTVMITTNNDIYGLGRNTKLEIIGSLPKTELTEFTRFYIKDEEGQIIHPISAFCNDCSTLYLVSKTKDSNKKFLAYSGHYINTEHPYFYDMNNLNPVALFGCNGSYYYSAIDDKGSVILIPYFSLSYEYKLEATYLPDGEKACNIAYGCCGVCVLTLSGRVLVTKTIKDKNTNSMKAIFIKYISFEGLKIANISGYSSCLALSEEGRIFQFGTFDYEQRCYINKPRPFPEFKEITLLKKYKIKEVYVGHNYYLFQTDEGKVISKGIDFLEKLLIDNQQTKVDVDNSSSPMEIVVTKDAKFCIAGYQKIAILVGIDPLMSPNRKISAKNVSVKNDYCLSSFIKNQIELCLSFDDNEEKLFFVNSGKIDENDKSITYKIIDKRTRTPMCKKILKPTIKNSIEITKKFRFLYETKHCCITKAIGINEKNALFFEYNEYKLEDVLKMKINNTFKARIALEIAHTVNHLQKKGMKNIGLKIDNIKFNSFFETKLDIFELILNDKDEKDFVNENDAKVFMSPTFLDNEEEEEENEKIDDAYSFGLILCYIFTQKFPLQKSKNKKRDNEIKLPPPSDSISSFCIDLIKKCLCIDQSNYPSFEEILSLMKENLFEFAPDVDSTVLLKRDDELDLIEYRKIKIL